MFDWFKRLWARVYLFGVSLNTTDEVAYVTTESGFRYRMLRSRPEDGYAAATAELRPGELLYRVHYDVLADREPFPVPISSEQGFTEGCQRWSDFDLAAGIPVQQPERSRISDSGLHWFN